MTDEIATAATTPADRFGEVRAGRVRRTVPVVGFAARAAGGRLAAGLRERAGNAGAVDEFHQRTAVRYAELLGHSKGVLMKAGQLLSTYETDAVDAGPFSVYQQALERLQADAPPMDPTTARELVERELGAPLDELFTEFSPEPIAAASIGQVHEARLPDGRHVAVKVQYPGVAQAIRDDLANTELLATFMKLGMSLTPRGMRTDQRSAAAEIAERIAEEVDYRHEARNITRFADLYRGHPLIRIPDVVPERSTARVLTMTFIDGIDWARARSADQELRNHWSRTIGLFAFGAYRHSNMFNADPHPGNYRFGTDGTVGFVDFGCVKQFPEYVRQGIVATFRATCDGDRDRVFALAQTHGFIGPDSDLTADDAFAWWSMMCATAIGPQPHKFVSADSTVLLRSLFDDSHEGGVSRRLSIPSDYVMLARINLGIDAVLADLGACIDTLDLANAVDGVGEPLTQETRLHREWVHERGLPFGMDPNR
ncbi:AarF/ABC1/UbiB kinase family protein [Gordonia sp. TBRC 11910]|uniref:AarF/ABC1/UbiB kinase family protein n=1 Tax=Gordonia asplenii TaxID=2725283 RepID=A0A848KXR1_9ACTN|nr:AarF/ABC1/UbiB kinase family protein [Gordonia asplenii]NMO01233.1 AarF/ABC1/UbiB kinase family protein [Gordonia asplenii]